MSFLLFSFFTIILLNSSTSSSSAFVIRTSSSNNNVVVNRRNRDDASSPSFLRVAMEDTTTTASSSSSSSSNNAASILRSTLEKRLASGSLSQAEINDAMVASDSLLEHLEGGGGQSSSSSSYSQSQLLNAATSLDSAAVKTMLEESGGNLQMDATTVDRAFWSVVRAVDDAEAKDLPLSADVTNMLHHIFDADLQLLLGRQQQIRTNITCMKPAEEDLDGAARRMNYVFDDGDHKNLPLTEGRRCEGGNCCDKCSRNIFPTFASEAESSLETFPELAKLTFNDLEKVSAATILQFVRLIERVRRTMAYEYGLPLKTLLPLQAYSRKYVAGTTQQGGGGGEGDFVTLHTDEATHEGYHYSCVIYLSTQGEDFEGGNFVFNDPDPESSSSSRRHNNNHNNNNNNNPEVVALDDDPTTEEHDSLLEALHAGELPEMSDLFDEDFKAAETTSLEDEIRRAGRKLTPFHPTRGSAVIFSSGWENMHEVEQITAGVRYAVPAFFTTCPVPEAAYDNMKVGKPQTEEDIADDWLHLLLAHRPEEPMESVGRVKELLMKWHTMCTPLCEH
eukprot:CAMPEP_0178933366 /NCGR_PEP_ID=MMETSP0786-20121207/23220_1 /TAXON_ID=186022 /ORGANISM="Thalassionema frauenfeldii, Strain CCMP 1798" /LENGTH=562 /DNA_ID=CAMNT_0020610935 /DNA_START=37 /DNA_END=1725 /DNA_ORIENTATION=+